MSENGKKGDEHLFIHLVSNFTQLAWVALGKLKNPVTDKVDKNIEEAGFYIDMLDMVKNRMKGNLSEDEEKFMESNLGSLKLNYVEEKKEVSEEPPSENEDEETPADSEGKDEAQSEQSDEEADADAEETKEETE